MCVCVCVCVWFFHILLQTFNLVYKRLYLVVHLKPFKVDVSKFIDTKIEEGETINIYSK